VGLKVGMDVLEERKIFCFYREWNPTSSSQQSVHSHYVVPRNSDLVLRMSKYFPEFLIFRNLQRIHLPDRQYFISHNNSGIDFFLKRKFNALERIQDDDNFRIQNKHF